jgi:hypothetical protein
MVIYERLSERRLYERLSERRSGIGRRDGELMKNKDFRQAAEMIEKTQSLENIKFVGEFGY